MNKSRIRNEVDRGPELRSDLDQGSQSSVHSIKSSENINRNNFFKNNSSCRLQYGHFHQISGARDPSTRDRGAFMLDQQAQLLSCIALSLHSRPPLPHSMEVRIDNSSKAPHGGRV